MLSPKQPRAKRTNLSNMTPIEKQQFQTLKRQLLSSHLRQQQAVSLLHYPFRLKHQLEQRPIVDALDTSLYEHNTGLCLIFCNYHFKKHSNDNLFQRQTFLYENELKTLKIPHDIYYNIRTMSGIMVCVKDSLRKFQHFIKAAQPCLILLVSHEHRDVRRKRCRILPNGDIVQFDDFITGIEKEITNMRLTFYFTQNSVMGFDEENVNVIQTIKETFK